MQLDTNELRSMEGFSEDDMADLYQQGFEPVPEHLDNAARRALNGKDSVFISKTSGGKLSNWAKGQRKSKADKRRIAKLKRQSKRNR